jgi:ferric-dicitrate binding protein FerR (iron transport regulator)
MLKNRAIEYQITSYLADECSPADRLVIAGLIQTDPEYTNTYNTLRQIWESPLLQPVSDEYNVDQAWLKMNAHIDRSPLQVVYKRSVNKFVPKQILRYAASIAAVVLLVFGAVWIFRNSDQQLKSYASGSSVSAPLALSDGSHIVLNSRSEVKYPEKFGNEGREVYFWGEAFFEIASDPTRPFVIETGDARIKVLGTSFNVNADPATGITEVVVNTGTVLFYYVDKNESIIEQITLHKGDKGIYNRVTRKLEKMLNNDRNVISWKTGILVFNETSLDKVMEVVGKKYDVSIHMEDAGLARLKLTATFDNESLDSVLEVLSLVHKLQFTQNGKDYLVKKVTG